MTTPQLDLALAFLDDFFGSNQRVLAAIKKPGAPQVATFAATDRDGQRDFMLKWNRKGCDVYFSPNPVASKN